MAHWYYYDSSNTKQGPVNDAGLKQLSSDGTITRDTIIENSAGKQRQAGKIQGLFSETSSETPVPKPPVNPANGSVDSSSNVEITADNPFVQPITPPPLPKQDNPFAQPVTPPQPPSFPAQDNPFLLPATSPQPSFPEQDNPFAKQPETVSISHVVQSKFCSACGNGVVATATICPRCGSLIAGSGVPGQVSRLVYILLAIFLGGFGIHNFYAGRVGIGVTQLLITFVCVPVLVMLSAITMGLLSPLLIIGALGMFVWIIVEICTVTTDSKGCPFV